jgi:hypothetical protein
MNKSTKSWIFKINDKIKHLKWIWNNLKEFFRLALYGYSYHRTYTLALYAEHNPKLFTPEKVDLDYVKRLCEYYEFLYKKLGYTPNYYKGDCSYSYMLKLILAFFFFYFFFFLSFILSFILSFLLSFILSFILSFLLSFLLSFFSWFLSVLFDSLNQSWLFNYYLDIWEI